jgi:integrase/recombinase XerC
MLFQDALDAYLLQLSADGRSSHTIRQYQRHLAAFAQTVGADRALDSITPTDVAQFMTAPSTLQGRSTATLNALRTSLRTFFGFVHASGLAPSNAGRMLRRAICAPSPPRGLSDAEVERLMDTLVVAQGPAARRDHMLVHVLLRAGLRLGSALALDRSDVDLERGELRVRVAKRQQPESVILSRELAEHLRGYLAGRGDGPLFTRKDGTRLGQRQAQRRMQAWFERAGLSAGASAHGLRHTFGCRVYAATGDVLLVKAAMRHRSIASTLAYVRADEGALRKVLGA